MFVLIDEYGYIAGKGKDYMELIKSFYDFQPNDATNTILYDIENHRSALIKANTVRYEGAEVYAENPWYDDTSDS